MRNCSSLDVWVPGKKSPYKKGYCTKIVSTLNIKKTDCNEPNIWISGTKKPFTKGKCAVPIL